MSKFEHASSGREMVCLANSNGGPCHLLGPLVGETRFHFIYRTRTSPGAHVPKRLAHLKPCRHCPHYREQARHEATT